MFQVLPGDAIAEGFRALCQRAEELTVALEFLPFGGVPNLRESWRTVRCADQPNGALLVDTWHWVRSGTTIEDLAEVPAERIVSVQVNDVREHPMDPLRPEALHWRLPPGHGFGKVIDVISALRVKGVEPRIVAAEVMNDDLLAAGLETTAGTIMTACREVLG